MLMHNGKVGVCRRPCGGGSRKERCEEVRRSREQVGVGRCTVLRGIEAAGVVRRPEEATTGKNTESHVPHAMLRGKSSRSRNSCQAGGGGQEGWGKQESAACLLKVSRC